VRPFDHGATSSSRRPRNTSRHGTSIAASSWIPASSSGTTQVPGITEPIQAITAWFTGRIEQRAGMGNVAFISRCASPVARHRAALSRLTRSSFCRDWKPCRSARNNIPPTHSKSPNGSRRIRSSNGHLFRPAGRSQPQGRLEVSEARLGVWSLWRQGGLEAGKKFINSVKLLSHLANIGDAKSW